MQFSADNICGEGGACIVYGMNLDGLRVAVKRLREDLRTLPGYAASYRKEFQIGQRLKHYALPTYRQLHDEIEDVYIVMDYVDGVSLRDRMTPKTLYTDYPTAY